MRKPKELTPAEVIAEARYMMQHCVGLDATDGSPCRLFSREQIFAILDAADALRTPTGDAEVFPTP